MTDAEVEKRPISHKSFQDKVDEILKEMKKDTQVCSYLLVNKDGFLESNGLPKDVHAETVGIMYATMCGASVTMNNELKKKSPQNMIINYNNSLTFITNIRDKYFLAVGLEKAEQLNDKLRDRVLKSVQEISDLV
jgi:predicted regulator of Ras-like GTPase activity (Roadblock/LC7/MglB family)